MYNFRFFLSDRKGKQVYNNYLRSVYNFPHIIPIIIRFPDNLIHIILIILYQVPVGTLLLEYRPMSIIK